MKFCSFIKHTLIYYSCKFHWNPSFGWISSEFWLNRPIRGDRTLKKSLFLQCSSESAYFDWNNDLLNGNPSQSATVVKSQSGKWISFILVPAALHRWRARRQSHSALSSSRDRTQDDWFSIADVFPNQMIDLNVSSVKLLCTQLPPSSTDGVGAL